MSRGDSFIFRYACGCAFGLSDVRPRAETEEAAWRAMYDTAAERKAAKAAGVTATREAWEDYSRADVYEQLSGDWKCPHKVVTA